MRSTGCGPRRCDRLAVADGLRRATRWRATARRCAWRGAWCDDLHGQVMELTRPGLGLYAAGISFATTLFTPLIAASVESLRQAGCSRARSRANVARRPVRSAPCARGCTPERRVGRGPLRAGDLAEVRPADGGAGAPGPPHGAVLPARRGLRAGIFPPAPASDVVWGPGDPTPHSVLQNHVGQRGLARVGDGQRHRCARPGARRSAPPARGTAAWACRRAG